MFAAELQFKNLVLISLTFVRDDINSADGSEECCTIAVISTTGRDLISWSYVLVDILFFDFSILVISDGRVNIRKQKSMYRERVWYQTRNVVQVALCENDTSHQIVFGAFLRESIPDRRLQPWGRGMKREWWWLFAVTVIAVGLCLSGCAGLDASRPQGQWMEDEGVQRQIETGTLFPSHSYYYLGSITAPDTFIAIDNQWQLRSRVWAEVKMTPQRLAGWLQWYRSEHDGGCEYRGGRILAPDGGQVGYWYSQNRFNIIYMPEPGVIEVYKPHAGAGRVCGEPGVDGYFPGWD